MADAMDSKPIVLRTCEFDSHHRYVCPACKTPWDRHAPTLCWELDPSMIEDNLEGEALEEHIAKLIALSV